jgi:hypothetical protein
MPKGTKSARAAVPPAERRRIQVGLIISAETKALIERESQRSGLTQSQVAERLIERALTYDGMFKAMNATLDEIRRRNVQAAMQREGYVPHRTPYGMAYLPPDTPLEGSGFKPWEPGEPVSPDRDVPARGPLPDRTAEAKAELEALIDAKIEAALRKQSEQT